MRNEIQEEHNRKVIEQFSKQAIPFKKIKGHYNSVDTIISMSEVSKYDKVLDLACGTGIVTCEFAKYAENVVGLDLTEAMINQAIEVQNENNLTNIKFELGNVHKLPYKDNTFDIVFTRYSFHHFLDKKQVFEEMIRVCKSKGKVIVVDVALEDKYEKAYNHMEKLRDPSHTKALTFKEFEDLFSSKFLSNHSKSSYKVDLELEDQLKASFPNKGDDDVLRKIFKNDIKENTLGINSHYKDKKIFFSYPITIFMAKKK
ncbi:methyltransferase domain-containing protein [Poseidonibacter lekithochrous]|uniref:class I SAM-dependent methyltransferase n=1 Tax=Poseidonibacter TaxID=2321187 RepID=UPI001C09A109|nr:MULTISPECIES: methyltransferase domain-containing protein [Poseidonibacter]MBU3015115.1 methyltransferase domain-containing protein [Poseidonibacter lekithochrous]MDO6828412.1 methyltransferase domain-containing protein [Poseidonibacter sp. 1_MG-2023]